MWFKSTCYLCFRFVSGFENITVMRPHVFSALFLLYMGPKRANSGSLSSAWLKPSREGEGSEGGGAAETGRMLAGGSGGEGRAESQRPGEREAGRSDSEPTLPHGVAPTGGSLCRATTTIEKGGVARYPSPTRFGPQGFVSGPEGPSCQAFPPTKQGGCVLPRPQGGV